MKKEVSSAPMASRLESRWSIILTKGAATVAYHNDPISLEELRHCQHRIHAKSVGRHFRE